MKILLVEFWHSHIYAEPLANRLRELGQEVFEFKEHVYFDGAVRVLAKAQDKYRLGPRVSRLNRDLLARVRTLRPDVVFLIRGAHVFPETLREIKRLGSYVIGWHNDDPFGPHHKWYVWRHFVSGIPLYNRLFAYRHANMDEYKRRGCARVDLLRSFFLRELNFPIDDVSTSPFRCDVTFIGHWENDGRSNLIEALLDEPGIDFRLWGTLWDRAANSERIRARFGLVEPVRGEAYNVALNSARICLVFLSKLNNDTYTRRCFEITAAGRFMLAPYTEDLASLFKEDVEAVYFRSRDEMMAKVRYYLHHESELARIAAAGRARLLRDGHEAIDRARFVLSCLRDDGIQ